MYRVASVVYAASSLIIPLTADAAAVTIAGDEPRKEITVTVESSTVGAVLQDLSRKYGFELKGVDYANTGDALSATLSGNLDAVVSRLLRNRNYVIVRSPDNASGIKKVLILDSTYGASPSKVVRNPNIEGAEELLQALSGNGSAE